jgi:hypothetical protein
MKADATNPELPRPSAKPPWQLVAVSIMGCCWAIDFLVPTFAHGIAGPLTLLPLLGFFAPVLTRSPRRRWRRVGVWLCVFEICLSALLWFNSISSFMNPTGIHVRLFGMTVATIWNAGGQFGYFAVRGLLFAAAAFLISSAPSIASDGAGRS